jgi:flavin reductase (DIM6/NTAB) family NADH-FMN oxidoreductase RutF
MDIRPTDLHYSDFYQLLLGSIAPRPIGWISTISATGQPNLAPYSFFNAVSGRPPIVVFAPSIRKTAPSRNGETKDSLRNVRETGEFVANVVTYDLAEAMNVTSGEYGAAANEFELAKVTPAPSHLVRPPRVAESPVNFECKVRQILDFGAGEEGSNLVIGEVVWVHVADAHVKDGKLDRNSLDLVGRMGGIQYSRTTQRFDMVRPKVG